MEVSLAKANYNGRSSKEISIETSATTIKSLSKLVCHGESGSTEAKVTEVFRQMKLLRQNIKGQICFSLKL